MCGFVHKDDFVEDSKQWAWTESQLNEKRILRRKAVLGLDDYKGDDDDDKAVAIPSQQGEEIPIRKGLRFCRVCSGVVAAISAQSWSIPFWTLSPNSFLLSERFRDIVS